MSAADLAPLAIPIHLAIGTVVLLLLDLALPASSRRLVGWGATALVAALLVASFFVDGAGSAFGGTYVGGPWALFLQRVVLAATVICLAGGLGFVERAWAHRQGEYHLLVLMSVLGMLLLPGARDLVLLVIAFELMGIPLYVLAAYGRTDGTSKTIASEAGLKLYFVGAASSAVSLFGLSIVAGLAGTTSLQGLAQAPTSPLLSAGLLLVLAGFGFKIGVAPFHAWVPDTYQGAATPFVAFLSVAPKVAGFSALASVFALGLPGQHATWGPVVVALAALTMVLGNLLAIPQSNVKRLLAFSGVAQVGYVLLGLAAGTAQGLAMLLFYLAAYVVANAGAFLVAHAVAESDGDESVTGMDGLARRSPWLALALLMFLLSLAGIPFVAGFWAKLYVFVAAWQAGLGWLVLLGAVLAVVGLFYYLGVAKAAYVTPPSRTGRVSLSAPLTASIAACLLVVVVMGLWPAPVLEAAERAAVWLVGG